DRNHTQEQVQDAVDAPVAGQDNGTHQPEDAADGDEVARRRLQEVAHCGGVLFLTQCGLALEMPHSCFPLRFARCARGGQASRRLCRSRSSRNCCCETGFCRKPAAPSEMAISSRGRIVHKITGMCVVLGFWSSSFNTCQPSTFCIMKSRRISAGCNFSASAGAAAGSRMPTMR